MNAVWQYYLDHRGDIDGWFGTTVWLAVLPVLIGLVIALPIGWAAWRYHWTYTPVTALAGLLYTIPSIALFLILPGILGTKILDPVNVAVALTLYTVALLVRVVADGLGSVSAETMAAASAMGFTGWQRLRKVQLPLAVPVIGAGLRVAAVSNVSLISVASVIGVTQLGQLFVDGNNLDKAAPIVLGLIIFFAMALLFDLLILLGVRVLTPWRRAVAAR
ncbi:MAG: ABC transporter permease [Jatrophihabitans sp.]|uniref:ABC transporter permease n=1 Tax=Jatrophihabitans sp. TaxID=1932789 RepID=UPI003F80D9E5